MEKYKACDFFMIRTPTMTVEKYFNLFDSVNDKVKKDNLIALTLNPIFQEALLIASGDLWNAIMRTDLSTSSKALEQILSSLLKYSIRITTRPTPFGLFSGISIGRFGKCPDKNFVMLSDSKKRARADMQWIYEVIKDIEANEYIRNSLKVRFNDYIYHNGNRLEMPSKSFLQQRENTYTNENATSIRFTSPVKYLEGNAKQLCLFSKLVEEIKEKYPQVTKQKISEFMGELLENEYLLSELRPPLIKIDALSYLIEVLESSDLIEANQYSLKLKKIQNGIKTYNKTNLGEGIKEYDAVVDLMRELKVSKNYLQVDIKNQLLIDILGEDRKAQLEDFVDAMFRMTVDEPTSAEMLEYIKKFSERYGYNSEVPLLEVLDIDQGIGTPSNYGIDVAPRYGYDQNIPDQIRRLDDLLKRKTLLALKQGKNTIELTEDDICYVQGDGLFQYSKHSMQILQSFEIYLMAHPSDKFSFTIAPAVGSMSVGRSFGRFDDILTKEESNMINIAINRHKTLLSDYIVAEITEVPTQGRISNITTNNSRYDYQVDLNSNPCKDKKVISIQDLYIGLDSTDNYFYIVSKSLKKRILVTTTNMLNRTFGSKSFRFLREISDTRRFNILNTIFRISENRYDYSPRIVYKKIVIKPETWRVSSEILGIKTKDKQEFHKKFIDYRKQWKIPRFILVSEADNRLMLDLEDPRHIDEVQHILKVHDKAISLVEITCNPENYLVKDKNGEHYVTEIVVPFILDSKIFTVKDKNKNVFEINPCISQNCMCIKQEDKIITPGSENWLYYKIYGIEKRQNELLAYIASALERMKNVGLLEKYFFIRYVDSDFHFRIRVKTIKGKISTTFLELNNFFEECRSNGMLSKVVIDTYQRETERYGGPKLIEAAEEYFYHDSCFVMDLVSRLRYGLIDTDLKYFAISYVIAATEAFGLSQTEQEKILETRANRSDYRKEFQDERKILMAAVDSDNDWKKIRSMIHNADIYDSLNKTKSYMKVYANKVIKLNHQKLTTNSVDDIIFSIIHMFCNRLMGNISWEKKIYALTRHAFHAKMEAKKHHNY